MAQFSSYALDRCADVDLVAEGFQRRFVGGDRRVLFEAGLAVAVDGVGHVERRGHVEHSVESPQGLSTRSY